MIDMTLTEFLLARIADDEAWARARQREDFRHHRVSAHRPHLAPDDPVRVLADCAAKRAIVTAHQGAELSESVDYELGLGLDLALRALAAVYADHSDYRPEWRPEA